MVKKKFFKTPFKSIIFLASLFILLFTNSIPTQAQTYAFELNKEVVHVFWESDGTLTLDYEFTFTNETYASPLDFVDVGIPTDKYNIGNVEATINSLPIRHIAESYYVENGIELGLEENSIPPGEVGIVRVRIWGIENVLHYDSTDETYASAVFSPTWFGSEYVSGFTDLTVVFHLPPGVNPEEPRYHQAPSGWQESPTASHDAEGRVMYTWQNEFANGFTQFLFGASFPASYVPEHTIFTPTLFDKLNLDLEALFVFLIFACFFGLFIGLPILSVIQGQRRKLKYLPPKISISGHGIKRGLTAIEAAILLEQPMDKIFTMILFAVIKKGAAKVIKQKPLKLEITTPQPNNLRAYEKNFLEAMDKDKKAKKKKALEQAMVKLVKSVTKSMKGFSRRETKRYYRGIIEKAWTQVETANTPKIRSEQFDKVMEWTLLDKDYERKTHDVFRGHTVYVPHWWGHYDPAYITSSSKSPRSSSTSSGSRSLPHLPGSDFAASIVNSVQDTAAGVIGSVKDFTSGVTKTTNPPPKPSSSSYSGGGGSSCACACACAGCACACAGGGR